MVFDVHSIMPKTRRELDQAKRQEYALHYSRVMQEKLGYIRKPENAASFDAIADYIAIWHAASHGECDYPRRGLFLYGEPGTGKTTAMQLFSGICGVDYIVAADMVKYFVVGGYEAFWDCADRYKYSHLIVDDIGCGDTARSYGNDAPFVEFIRERERIWTEKGVCTFFTSNAKSREDVTAKYGLNVCSRLLGMCDFLKFGGCDNRLKRSGK